MKTQKGSIVVIFLVLGLVLLAGLFLLLIELNKGDIQSVDRRNEKIDQVSLNANTNIKEAMRSFKAVVDKRKETGVQGLFCTGGFINQAESSLKNIADTIVSNRIIATSPTQYAITQDEAGITCLGSIENWVLFTALNPVGESDTKNYWCIDSRGVEGNYGFNSETNQCLSESTL